ncbi:hypothetical protein [Aestuariispira insulae]|uniref:Uncharacterized protein n=1 Tax=Aestuariispira insulae TaxID=1461337 RepID=A0A3D9HS13_9PROT|nr:hypothetical protein [Aestuariispira insulae]RED52287.1 hypothetical protein DFP90_102306 [Aestuariispira insulae]
MTNKTEPAVDLMPSMRALCTASENRDRNNLIIKRFRAVVDRELDALKLSGLIDDHEDTGDVLQAILENRLKPLQQSTGLRNTCKTRIH